MSDNQAERTERFTRAEAWAWFISSAPESKKRRKKSAKAEEEDKRSFRLRFYVMEGRLLAGMWQGMSAKPVGLYYMTPFGEYYATTDGQNFSRLQMEYLPLGQYDYYGGTYKNRYLPEDPADADVAAEWLVKHFGGAWWMDGLRNGRIGRDRVTDCISDTERYISGEKRRQQRERRLQRISEYCNGAPQLPDGMDGWLRSGVFGGREFAFLDRERGVYRCSACGGEHPVSQCPSWRANRDAICPETGRTVTVRKGGKEQERAWERVMVIQSYTDMKGRPCAVARHFTAESVWDGYRCGGTVHLWPDVMLILPRDGTACREIFYCQGGALWSDRNTFCYQAGNGYCYPDTEALRGTVYNGMGLSVAAERLWKMNWNCLMRDYHNEPRVEYLIKGGFRRLVFDLADNTVHEGKVFYRSLDGEDGNRVRATDMLGLNGQDVARLRQHDGGGFHLSWLRAAERCGWKLSDCVWDYLASMKVRPNDLAFAFDRGLTPEKVVNYLDTQKKRGMSRGYAVTTWRDTVDMGQKLHIDMTLDMNLRPRDLKARHDALTDILQKQKDALAAEEMERQFPEVRPVCDRIRAVYEYSDGVHTVTVPRGVADIVREGRLLSHCVASNERYLDRIADGESYILFLRRAEAPDTPWYTMEVEPGGKIRQLRTLGDTQGADREEAKAFLRVWAKVVHDRCGREELQAAEVSREKRLREFEALRAGGNIIRRGLLAGKPLVEVLEADFAELNTEERERKENVS